jgi:DNA repair exonuclease SbcCD ATPase subunit/DNA repair exonuclease SbcCD nuclease subunit
MNMLCALSGDSHTNTSGRTEEAHRVHEAMLDGWKSRGVHFIGLAGDWNEVPPSEQDQAWSRDFLGRCAEVAPVVLIYGNHDPAGSLDEFHMQSEHRYPITVVDRPDVIVVDTAAGKLAVACVPFVWKAHLLAKMGSMSVEDADLKAEELLRHIFLGLGGRVRELGLPTVGLVHGKWRGSRLNADQPNRPLGMEIEVESIGALNAGFVCVGHIHLAQETSFNGISIATPSSPFYVDYGEAKHEKGFIWAEFEEVFDHAEERIDKGIGPWEVKWERVPTPVMPMLLIEDSYSIDEDGGAWAFHCVFPDIEGADVRFRFHYPKEHEKAAKAEAEAIAAAMLVAGAVNVKLDPVPDPAIRARIPGLAEAVTLESKAGLYRESLEVVVADDEQKILDEYLHTIQDELANEGVSLGIQSRAVPTLKRIKGKGWLCFPNEFDIDITRFGELTAIVAPNESGKSLLMSLAGPGLLYGDTPNRGSLNELSRARDSYIEGVFEMNGVEYTLSQMCNGMLKTPTGAVSLVSGGKPVLQKAGRAEYAAWAEKNLLPWNQYLTLLFHSGVEDDGGRKINIIDMKDGARTELMLRVLGIEFYEAIAKRARDKSAAVASELGKVNARMEELRGGPTIEFCEQTLAKTKDEKRVADETLRLGELTLKDLQAKNAVTEKQRTEYNALVTRRVELESQEAKLAARIAELDTLIQNNSGLLDKADEIRAAVTRLEEISVALNELQGQASEQRVRESEINAETRQIESEERTANERAKSLQAEMLRLNILIAGAEAARSAAASIAEFEESLKETEHDRDSALANLEDIQSANVVGLAGRVSHFRGDMRFIAEGTDGGDPASYASGSLENDDKLEKDAEEQPTRLRTAKAAWQQADARAKEIGAQVASLRLDAAKLEEIDRASSRLSEASDALTQAGAELNSLSERKTENATAHGEILGTLGATNATIKALTSEAGELNLLARRAAPLAEAEAKIAAYQQEREKIAADREGVLELLSKVITEAVEPPKLLNLVAEELAVTHARDLVTTYNAAFTLARKALDDAKARESRQQELGKEAQAFTRQIDRWNRLAREFGVDGLQKEEVANAGPRLTELTNELLHAGGDTRHTVDIRTERPHSRDKNKMIPCFEIIVRDSEEQADKESRRLSGAGQVIVGKPLAMAMVKMGCERAGITSCTVWFDELTGPADSENSVKLIGMVRHFAKSLNAQVFYVSQDPEIQAMADSRLSISAGAISVS